MFVRKGSVVWQVALGHGPLQWRNAKKAQALTQLKKYAAKQMRRVGTGAAA